MSASLISRRGKGIPIVVCTILLLAIAANVAAQDNPFIIWVYDIGARDSQFGYFDGTIVQSTEPRFVDQDFEGLACLNNTIYAASAMDGLRPSTLYTVQIDVATGQTTLALIGELQSAQQAPFFEVTALSEKADGTLWGFAGQGDSRGLLQIDPTTAVAELVVPSTIGVEGIEWLDDTLWLVARDKFYTWQPGGALTFAFQLGVDSDIEALDVVNGLLWIGIHKDNRGVIAVDPATGAIVPDLGFPGADDIESLTFCPPVPNATPTATPTATATVTPTLTDTPPSTETPTATPTEYTTILLTEEATVLPTATPTTTPTASPTPTVADTPTPSATPTPTVTPTVTVLATVVTAEPPTPRPPTGEDPVDEPMPHQYPLYLPLVTNR